MLDIVLRRGSFQLCTGLGHLLGECELRKVAGRKGPRQQRCDSAVRSHEEHPGVEVVGALAKVVGAGGRGYGDVLRTAPHAAPRAAAPAATPAAAGRVAAARSAAECRPEVSGRPLCGAGWGASCPIRRSRVRTPPVNRSAVSRVRASHIRSRGVRAEVAPLGHGAEALLGRVGVGLAV